jgi:hypothetical protein
MPNHPSLNHGCAGGGRGTEEAAAYRHQCIMSIDLHPQREDKDAVAWRRDLLTRCGFSLELASALAGDPDHDVHRLIELVEHGCSPQLAVRILAPTEPGSAA